MRTVILGFDAFDPVVFERLSDQGRLPHLTRLGAAGGYAPFRVANPAQSEVSWTSIATGLNPGGHGIFDFVHRDPATYALYVSLLPTRRAPGGARFTPPFNARTIFDQAVARGYPATSLWWPATFPARPASPVRTIPGLGTPDIHGKLGVGTLFSSEVDAPGTIGKTSHQPLRPQGRDRWRGQFRGPAHQARDRVQDATLDFEVERLDDAAARLVCGELRLDLRFGAWSPILELCFRMGRFVRLHALTRVLLTRTRSSLELYCLPLQLHPLHSPWHYASPRSFAHESWRAAGPFLTLGWAQDTTGLEDGCLTDQQFLALCDSIDRSRESVLLHHLKAFREGVIGIVLDTLDRVQHMFWREAPDVVERWYVKLDALVGRVEAQLAVPAREPARLVILSDHGFAPFDFRVHLNHWLRERGYLGAATANGAGTLREVEWGRTRAYALGLNSLYLNLEGREGKGIVPSGERSALANRLRDELLNWRDADKSVVRQVWQRDEVFEGDLTALAPDLVVGYAPGYRASPETGLGGWDAPSIAPNRAHWAGDHCIDPTCVPGVLFSTEGLNFPHPTYRDIPALTIEGAPDPQRAALPDAYTDEEQEVIQERLRSLGYF